MNKYVLPEIAKKVAVFDNVISFYLGYVFIAAS